MLSSALVADVMNSFGNPRSLRNSTATAELVVLMRKF